MNRPSHKTEGVNHTKTMRFYPKSFSVSLRYTIESPPDFLFILRFAIESPLDFLHTGKEKDAETGYGYFGARYMDHELMTMWLSVDPMSDKYPSISPYAYCAWNPIKLMDPDGREVNPVYDLSGNFIGNTKEGFTGEPIISTRDALKKCTDFYGVSDISELSAADVLDGFGETFDNRERKGELSPQAQENIFTDIVSKMEGTSVEGNTFSMRDIGGKIHYYPKSPQNLGNIGTNAKKHTIYANHQYNWYETTVENFQASVVYHEWYGHIIKRWGNGNQGYTLSQGGTHYKCYQAVKDSPIYNKTTIKYQKFYETMLESLSR